MSCPHCKTRFIAASSSQDLPPQADRCTRIATPRETADGIQPRAAKQGQGNKLPARIGRFQIRALRGAGAFGTVYRAYDPQLDREVALKVPLAGVLDSPLRIERFLREARAAAQLRHPHIVPVHEAGHDGDQYYIASAFIEGQTLAEECDEGPLEPRRAAQIVRDLAEALSYAHEQGIVHRDVKPANVMIDAKGRPHLMDFGLAARQDSEEKLTVDGAILGTAAYMAPEHASGQQGDPKAASDQYSLGVVLYELLCGRTPFAGPASVMLFNAVHTEPPSPRSIRPNLPRDLETICITALAKNPDERFENCQEFADDLRRWLEDEPIHRRRLSIPERVVRWCKREPKVAVTTLVALISLASLALVASFSAGKFAELER
ncbi:MAG TPA: serine/threonine-protein kinase, partial [Gemmataceae bacterium]|nr:serine/threonine-protein kinase [Gemmataceae bacterium]